jgi:thymidylate synthase
MNLVQSTDGNDLLIKLCNLTLSEGKVKSTATGINISKVLELGKCLIEVKDATKGIVKLAGRKNNIAATLLESMWVLSGRETLPDSLINIVPRLTAYCDNDDNVFRGGYGMSLVRKNQLEHSLLQLKLDINTRKAVSLISDIDRDSIEGYLMDIGSVFTKDNVCNLALLFEVTDNKLNCTVLNRSNDILHGLTNVNLTEFTIIQRFMAALLNVEVGSYYVLSNNVHLYCSNKIIKKQVDNIIKEPIKETESSAEDDVYKVFSQLTFGSNNIINWNNISNMADKVINDCDLISLGNTALSELTDIINSYKINSIEHYTMCAVAHHYYPHYKVYKYNCPILGF